MSRDRRTLVVGAAVVVSLLGVRTLIPKWNEWQRGREQAALAVASDLVASRRAFADVPRLRDSLASRRRQLAQYDSSIVRASSTSIAAAEIAAYVASLAGDVKFTVASQQVLPDTVAIGGWRRVGVRVIGTGDVQAVASLLRELSSDSTLLSVRELSISQSDGTGLAHLEVLRVELVIDALCAIDPAART